jgi:hypothetical protein
LNGTIEIQAISAIPQPEQFKGYRLFMTPPGPECTSSEPEKHQVWPNCDSPANRSTRLPGKITERPGFAFRQRADIILKLENYRSFLDICDLVRRSFRAGQAAKRPGSGGGYEP